MRIRPPEALARLARYRAQTSRECQCAVARLLPGTEALEERLFRLNPGGGAFVLVARLLAPPPPPPMKGE